MKKLILTALALSSSVCLAWGRHGHHIVGETGAVMAAEDTKTDGLKAHAYDMGYYANVPDLIFKRPATYEMEKPQHFMDLEIFHRAFKAKPEVKEPFALTRAEFDAAFPDVKNDAGRAFWRIREMMDELGRISDQLRKLEEPKGKARQELQKKWVMVGGIMAHYIGDLGMPLHVSENYDGQLTGQKGLHSFFEDVCVDEVHPRISDKVMQAVRKEWPAFKKKNSEKPLLTLLDELTKSSGKEVPGMLKIDKASKRDMKKVTCPKFESLIVRRLTASSLLLAELYRRNLGWTFDNDRFFFFAGEPDYIKPGPITEVNTAKH